jgi:AraC family transcriptional regulator
VFDLSITHRVFPCEPGSAVTEPAQERHGNVLGSGGARVVVIQPDPLALEGLGACGRLFDEVRHARRSPACGPAWRIARELHAPDSATPLAVEGLVLEMLALASRQDRRERWLPRPPAWLHGRAMSCTRASGIRRGYASLPPRPGSTPIIWRAPSGYDSVCPSAPCASVAAGLGGYSTEVAEEPIARIALEAGFADQSHFTRAFKRHTE